MKIIGELIISILVFSTYIENGYEKKTLMAILDVVILGSVILNTRFGIFKFKYIEAAGLKACKCDFKLLQKSYAI